MPTKRVGRANANSPGKLPAAERRLAVRAAIFKAAIQIVREVGIQEVQVAMIALRAGVGVGSVYQNFDSRSHLLSEVFRVTAAKEFQHVLDAIETCGEGAPASTRLAAAISTFCSRALHAGRFGYALMVEPVAPEVEDERLKVRDQYYDLYAGFIREGIEDCEFPPQDVAVSAAALVGLMIEVLVRPLGQTNSEGSNRDMVPIIDTVITVCFRALGADPDRRPRA